MLRLWFPWMWHLIICRCYRFFGGTYCFHLQGSLIRLLPQTESQFVWNVDNRLSNYMLSHPVDCHLHDRVLELAIIMPYMEQVWRFRTEHQQSLEQLMCNTSLTTKTVYLPVSLHSTSLPSYTSCAISVKRGCGSCIPSSTSSPSMNCTRWAGGVTGIFRVIVLTNIHQLISEQTQNARAILIVNKALQT
jgi:hypothetical protein